MKTVEINFVRSDADGRMQKRRWGFIDQEAAAKKALNDAL